MVWNFHSKSNTTSIINHWMEKKKRTTTFWIIFFVFALSRGESLDWRQPANGAFLNGDWHNRFKQCWQFVQATTLSKCIHRFIEHNGCENHPLKSDFHQEKKKYMKLWFMCFEEKKSKFIIKWKMCRSWHQVYSCLFFSSSCIWLSAQLSLAQYLNSIANWHYLHMNRLNFRIQSIYEIHW